MKNILKTSIFAFLLIALGSCTTQEDNPVAIAKGAAKLLTPATGTSLILSPANASTIATTLVWNFSDNGIDSPSSYTVQIAKGGTNFATPIDAGTTNDKFLSWTVEQLNGKLDPAIFIPFSEANVDVRIKSALGSGLNTILQYSNIITLKVTPYSLALPKLGVPGNHQGWTPATAPILASSGYGKTNFEGYISLDGGYKFLTQRPNGSFNWGAGFEWADDGSFSGILVGTGGSNCTAIAGYYLVKANTGAITTQNPSGLTYSATPISSWGIIGDATPNGWGSSTALSYNSVTKKWSTTIALTAGKQCKFRANDAWTINIGKFDAGKINNDYGGENMSYDGGNIDIATSGTYIVTLDLSNPRDYKYTIVLQ